MALLETQSSVKVLYRVERNPRKILDFHIERDRRLKRILEDIWEIEGEDLKIGLVVRKMKMLTNLGKIMVFALPLGLGFLFGAIGAAAGNLLGQGGAIIGAIVVGSATISVTGWVVMCEMKREELSLEKPTIKYLIKDTTGRVLT